MNGRHLVLICVLGAANAGASTTDARVLPVAVALSGNGSIGGNAGSGRANAVTAQSLPKLPKGRRRPTTQANIADLGGGVVKEMKATSAFVQESAAKAGAADSWLVALSGFGLVILQLRRKHKSLPQRRIVPYA